MNVFFFDINFAEDGVALGEAIEAFAKAVRASGLIVTYSDAVKYLNNALKLKVRVPRSFFKSEEAYVALGFACDGISTLLNTTIVRALSETILEFAEEHLPEDFAFVFDQGLSGEEFVEDLATVVDMVRILIDAKAYEYFADKDLNLNQPEVLNALVSKLFELHIHLQIFV